MSLHFDGDFLDAGEGEGHRNVIDTKKVEFHVILSLPT